MPWPKLAQVHAGHKIFLSAQAKLRTLGSRTERHSTVRPRSLFLLNFHFHFSQLSLSQLSLSQRNCPTNVLCFILILNYHFHKKSNVQGTMSAKYLNLKSNDQLFRGLWVPNIWTSNTNINCSRDYECQIYEHKIQTSIVLRGWWVPSIWTLNPNIKCSGDYECQISTTPVRSLKFLLQVVGEFLNINGNPISRYERKFWAK